MQTTECIAQAINDLRDDPNRVADEQFWRIVERFRATLINQAYCILGSQEDAEDVAQETLCKAFRTLHQLREAGKVGAWLRRMNHRHALVVYRRHHAAREERLATGHAGEIPAPKTSHNTTSVHQAMRDKIVRAMDSLPDGYREVLALRYWEKLSNAQIASRLDIPEGTVRSRLARADSMMIQKLKTSLEQEQHPK
jgi:RNA polymerase sigma-70 factor, ECF subfamily